MKRRKMNNKRLIVTAALMCVTLYVQAESESVLANDFNPAAAEQLMAKGIEKLVFIKRKTLNSNHYYTEYLNSAWTPGGNLCMLDLKTGAVREVVPELNGGVFNRFDVSFDAKRIVFDYKKAHESGYRIYEVNADGSGLRQLTFSPENEAELIERYGSKFYHHGTDDMHPCYLPDGGIAFVSTRVHQSILCNRPDTFTTKTMHRMDADGSNMKRLSHNAVSEAAPALMADGRIMYHRWEYNDKSSDPAKCLWSMYPNGAGSAEVYGNTVTAPDTLIYGRPIPNAPGKFSVLISTHCGPNNALGSVGIIDISKDIRTLEPLSYVTKDIDAPTHKGFHFKIDGKWVEDHTGVPGRLFKDPYPVSEDLFIVTQKPKGFRWDDPAAYDLYLLNGDGETEPLYQAKDISCWHPVPLVEREKPTLASPELNPALAEENMAECIVQDVYFGMPKVKRGTIKYLRVMEQVGRPWGSRNFWKGDYQTSTHTAIGIARSGVKVQYGIVPVEADGSAYFKVPADRNIFFQLLDENFMMVQTERTFVNYMPGERRSCVGCHERPGEAPINQGVPTIALALRRPASVPGPQPGETEGRKVFDYMRQIQPIWDAHCLSCHSGPKAKGGLDLTPGLTRVFVQSYENLMATKLAGKTAWIGEYLSAKEPGHGTVEYREAYLSGSPTSPLVTILSNGRIPLRHPDAENLTARLVKAHKTVKVSQAEFVTVVNWIDTFGQFYPSYWGLKNAGYQDQKFFRPEVTVEEALSKEIPACFRELYYNPPQGVKIVEEVKKRKKKKKIAPVDSCL